MEAGGNGGAPGVYCPSPGLPILDTVPQKPHSGEQTNVAVTQTTQPKETLSCFFHTISYLCFSVRVLNDGPLIVISVKMKGCYSMVSSCQGETIKAKTTLYYCTGSQYHFRYFPFRQSVRHQLSVTFVSYNITLLRLTR